LQRTTSVAEKQRLNNWGSSPGNLDDERGGKGGGLKREYETSISRRRDEETHMEDQDGKAGKGLTARFDRMIEGGRKVEKIVRLHPSYAKPLLAKGREIDTKGGRQTVERKKGKATAPWTKKKGRGRCGETTLSAKGPSSLK